MDDFNDLVLIRRGHFVVAGEAEAAMEDVCADVLRGAGDVGICLGTPVAGCRYKRVIAVDGLHVHRLPDRAAFGIEGGDGGEDLRWGRFTRDRLIKKVSFSAHLRRHGGFIHQKVGCTPQ